MNHGSLEMCLTDGWTPSLTLQLPLTWSGQEKKLNAQDFQEMVKKLSSLVSQVLETVLLDHYSMPSIEEPTFGSYGITVKLIPKSSLQMELMPELTKTLSLCLMHLMSDRDTIL